MTGLCCCCRCFGAQLIFSNVHTVHPSIDAVCCFFSFSRHFFILSFKVKMKTKFFSPFSCFGCRLGCLALVFEYFIFCFAPFALRWLFIRSSTHARPWSWWVAKRKWDSVGYNSILATATLDVLDIIHSLFYFYYFFKPLSSFSCCIRQCILGRETE